jgi:tetratricopeptide (TPR) repeat protein
MNKLGLLTIILLAFAFNLFAQTADEIAKSDAFFQQGIKFEDNGDYRKAIQSYTEVIKIRPNRPNAWFNRGNCYYAIGNYQQSVKDLSEAVRINPTDAEAYDLLGGAYLQLNQLDSAVTSFDRAFIILSDDTKKDSAHLVKIFQIQARKAVALVAKKDYDNALKSCLESQLNFLESYQNDIRQTNSKYNKPNTLADVWLIQLGSFLPFGSLAQETSLNCLKIFPKQSFNEQQLLLLSNIALTKIGIDRTKASIWEQQANIYFTIRNSNQALETINKAIQAFPKDKKMYLQRAAIYRQMNRNNLALADETTANQIR